MSCAHSVPDISSASIVEEHVESAFLPITNSRVGDLSHVLSGFRVSPLFLVCTQYVMITLCIAVRCVIVAFVACLDSSRTAFNTSGWDHLILWSSLLSPVLHVLWPRAELLCKAWLLSLPCNNQPCSCIFMILNKLNFPVRRCGHDCLHGGLCKFLAMLVTYSPGILTFSIAYGDTVLCRGLSHIGIACVVSSAVLQPCHRSTRWGLCVSLAWLGRFTHIVEALECRSR
jgi:hypothetical protein